MMSDGRGLFEIVHIVDELEKLSYIRPVSPERVGGISFLVLQVTPKCLCDHLLFIVA